MRPVITHCFLNTLVSASLLLLSSSTSYMQSLLYTKLCQFLTDFQNSFTDRLRSKFAVKSSLQFPPHRIRVATLPCKVLMSENKLNNLKQTSWLAINHRGSTAIHTESCLAVCFAQFLNIGNFWNINISQSSVATWLRCGWILNNHFTANLLEHLWLSVK